MKMPDKYTVHSAGSFTMLACEGQEIAQCELSKSETQIIANKLNCHDELIKELERAKDELLRRTNIDTDDYGLIENWEQLLKRAKGEV